MSHLGREIRSSSTTTAKTVLLAAEDGRSRGALAVALRGRGFRVTEVGRLAVLLDWISQMMLDPTASCAPDLIICDISLAKAATLDALAMLRRLAAAPTLICITPRTSPDATKRARDIGASVIFNTPFDCDEVATVCQVVAPCGAR